MRLIMLPSTTCMYSHLWTTKCFCGRCLCDMDPDQLCYRPAELDCGQPLKLDGLSKFYSQVVGHIGMASPVVISFSIILLYT